MPVCPTCRGVYFERESHVCDSRFTSQGGRWRAFADAEPGDPALKLRPILIAVAVALALTSPVLFRTGELAGLEVVLVFLMVFLIGLVRLIPGYEAMAPIVPPFVAGWMMYGLWRPS